MRISTVNATNLYTFQWTTLASGWPMKERIPASLSEILWTLSPLLEVKQQKDRLQRAADIEDDSKNGSGLQKTLTLFEFVLFDWAFLLMCFDHVSPNTFKTTSQANSTCPDFCRN